MLEPRYKLFWVFILDMCNHAGILDFDLELFSFMLGVDFDKDKIKEVFGDRIKFFEDDNKLFIPSFIDFQYGSLSENNKVHLSVINLLKKQGLFKGLTSPIKKAMDKDKDKLKEKDKEKDMSTFNQFWDLYDYKQDKQDCVKKWFSLTKADHHNILQAVPKYILSKPEKQYRLYPFKYLNRRSWENEIVAKELKYPDQQLMDKLAEIGFKGDRQTKAYAQAKEWKLDWKVINRNNYAELASAIKQGVRK